MFLYQYQLLLWVRPLLRAALSQEERNALDDVARDEENFRNGLKRNIAQLSNLARVNKEELVTLREQVQRVRSSCFSNGRIMLEDGLPM